MIQTERLPFDASNCKGYRLELLEVLNWGTFDGQVYSVRPHGETTLLVGQNGSGKSTLVDAILTLLVRPGIRNFNVAAGAGKRERTERTYFEGAYDRNSEDDGSGIRTQCLRPKKNHYSVLLAGFHNGDTTRSFTVAQVLYWTSQSVEKVYCFSDGLRSIREDFGGLESTDGILRTLKDRGLRVSRTFSEFEGWFARATRIKPKAMEVFNQTVAVKDIQRLNDFIRNHMLEPRNWSEKVERLLGHFTQLSEAHASLVRVREQSDLLDPVARIGKQYQQRADEFRHAERLLSAADAFFSQKTVELFTPVLEQRQEQLTATRSRKDALAHEIEQTLEQCRGLRNEIDQAGGDRLKQIPLLIETERAQADAKRRAWTRYEAAAKRGGITETVGDAEAFAAQRERLPELRRELEQKIADRNEKRETLTLARGDVRRNLGEYRLELQGLEQRRENLPQWCVSLRGAICDELGLSPKDLPFAAELISVLPEEREWEASIEKVLRSFALSLLVPDRLYRLVSTHVDQTRLAVQGRGQRLVYLRVGEQAAAGESQTPDVQSLIRKLQFRRGHLLTPWVQAEVIRRFDYRCCETVEEFQQCRGLALTRSRHAKSTSRHDKDDREQVFDPRNFVLGWDNREKKQRIAAEIQRLQEVEAGLDRKIDRIDRELGELRARFAAFEDLQGFADYSEIAYEPHAREIAALEDERRAIEEQSDAIRHLKQRLAEAEARQTALQADRDEVVAEERELENQIEQGERLVTNAKADLERRTAEHSLEAHRESFADLESSLRKTPLTVENFFEQKDVFRRKLEAEVSRLRERVEPVKNQLIEAMTKFLRVFPEETDLHPSCDYLESFLGLRQRILEEDLPRHERRFKDRLNEKVIHEIGLFRGDLEGEKRGIEDKIETLNTSLRRLEYRPGTYIQLEPRPVRDAEIVKFQGKLRECIEGSFDDSAEANEARFLRIQELVERLRDESNRRWRDKVTDVRRWFDFVANVIDELSLTRVSSYDDSTGQSGGEKAKLAFTILVAAIAYQYDLDPEHPVSDRLHFVVVDEMFSKVDDQHAEYALELFKQFGLQLLIVAPLDAKARVTQPYVGCYLHVDKRNNRSEVFQMTAREFEESVVESDNGRTGAGRTSRSVSRS